MQADGRILVAGTKAVSNANLQLVRYKSDGSLDTTFASGGKLVIDFGGFQDQAESIAVQPTARSCSAAWRAKAPTATGWRGSIRSGNAHRA